MSYNSNSPQPALTKDFKAYLVISLVFMLIEAAVSWAKPFLLSASPTVQTAVHLRPLVPIVIFLTLLCVEMARQRQFRPVPLLLALTGNGFTAMVVNRLIGSQQDQMSDSPRQIPLPVALGLLLAVASIAPLANRLSPRAVPSAWETALKIGCLLAALPAAWSELRQQPRGLSAAIALTALTYPNLAMMLLLFFRHERISGASRFDSRSLRLFLYPFAALSVANFFLWLAQSLANIYSIELTLLSVGLYSLLGLFCCVGLAVRTRIQRFECRRLLLAAALLVPTTALWAWPYCATAEKASSQRASQ